MLEKLIVARLRAHLVGDRAISDKQHGFRSGRSTLDALSHVKKIAHAATVGHVYHHKMVSMLTLDVRNAFNSAPWSVILEAARARQVPAGLMRMIEAYLSDRTIGASSPSGLRQYHRDLS